jgi:hypothetical protein
LAFHSRTFPDQYKLKHINFLETLAMSMVVWKFKGYITGHAPTLVTDSQYVKRVMKMSGKRLDALPSNILRWIRDIKEETNFTKYRAASEFIGESCRSPDSFHSSERMWL